MNQIPMKQKSQFLPIHKRAKFISFLSVICLVVCLLTLSLYPESNPKIKKELENIPIKEKHKKPIVAVIGENQYTELTDFLIPFGILKRSGIVKIHALAPNRGIMNLFPALSLEIETSLDDFDSLHPEGADLVIVPAIHNAKNKTIIQWIQNQSKRGATIVGICDGVWTLGHAGLLKDKNATGHWYSMDGLKNQFTDTKWTQNRRYVQDQNIITTTGVTASLPISIAIIEFLADQKKAKRVAEEFGIPNWSANHNSEEFDFTWKHYLTAAKNLTFVWNYETIGMNLYEGIDEVSLALLADSYSRTYKSKAVAIGNHPFRTKSGILILPETKEEETNKIDLNVKIPIDQKPFVLFLENLHEIQKRYGKSTFQFVATQLEFSM
ncbi:Transcriptional regulator [Leptospira biflexa serovar Patoc strain 'Patoc 1 (Ames)']|nr:Transcriptional regulator [Leptospira biflexa serovar Patoc strain 'Patoc 1 (Ames)']